MTFDEIATKAEELREEQGRLCDTLVVRIAAQQYPQLGQALRIMNDLTVLTRNLARNLGPADEPKLPNAGSFS